MNNDAPETLAAARSRAADLEQQLKLSDEGVSRLAQRCLELEQQVLYYLFRYPEKYWKLVNFYYNGKKTWISEKNYEKLEKIRNQESDRQKFIAKIKDLTV